MAMAIMIMMIMIYGDKDDEHVCYPYSVMSVTFTLESYQVPIEINNKQILLTLRHLVTFSSCLAFVSDFNSGAANQHKKSNSLIMYHSLWQSECQLAEFSRVSLLAF